MKEISSLSLLISKINGLNSNWAKEHEINPYQIKPLYALYLDSTMTQTQIAECCSLPKQTVSNTIRQLKNQGFITLKSSSSDKREKAICITESGKAYLENATEPIVDLEKRIIARMGRNAYESLVYGLNEYASAMEIEAKK